MQPVNYVCGCLCVYVFFKTLFTASKYLCRHFFDLNIGIENFMCIAHNHLQKSKQISHILHLSSLDLHET